MTRTNLITGFLGSGKTTSILHLLAHKDPAEKWAVLVNEFGEVGIDGALLADSGALLKEIPGGCMCCVNGLPMQVGLNTLLRQGKPDRLLIEPTGLGHPKQILDLLTAPVYEPWIDLRATLCILDPRQLLDKKSVDNENFRDQLAAADVIVANKSDRATDESKNALQQWWQQWWQQYGENRLLVQCEQGRIDGTLLDLPRKNVTELPASAAHSHQAAERKGLAALSLPAHQRWRRSLNSGQGHQACGWIFDADTVFDTIGVLEWARLAPVARVKGVMRIAEGLVRINRQGDDLHIETQNVAPPDSRIELISSTDTDWNALQSALLKLRLVTGE
ncbi:CobW family GTP-binding protein [Escherichia fergusonii]|uniref:CobW family GTP-binding protein n=1 Tax=Escherichia fergusonii TaxID=564 RepID=UPI0015EF972F|nr:GTP-binding protein [Escherichia fergusonii]MBA8274769.1 GTP-binding protein [Escherichia fergusonii]QMI01694.1 GTP-binding protein [Escherichia fergusonii]